MKKNKLTEYQVKHFVSGIIATTVFANTEEEARTKADKIFEENLLGKCIENITMGRRFSGIDNLDDWRVSK